MASFKVTEGSLVSQLFLNVDSNSPFCSRSCPRSTWRNRSRDVSWYRFLHFQVSAFSVVVPESSPYAGVRSWYKRAEMGSKIAFFFSSATLSGAFSGLLSVAIHNMDGVGGLAGWRWIFILEGLVTVVVALLSFWVIQDYPENAKFLSEKESMYVQDTNSVRMNTLILDGTKGFLSFADLRTTCG